MKIKLGYAAAIAAVTAAAVVGMTPVANAATTGCETRGTGVVVCQHPGHASVSVDPSPHESWRQYPYTWGGGVFSYSLAH
jgi:hypothetical protein